MSVCPVVGSANSDHLVEKCPLPAVSTRCVPIFKDGLLIPTGMVATRMDKVICPAQGQKCRQQASRRGVAPLSQGIVGQREFRGHKGGSGIWGVPCLRVTGTPSSSHRPTPRPRANCLPGDAGWAGGHPPLLRGQ